MDWTLFISNTAETSLIILSPKQPPDCNPTPKRHRMGQLYQGTGSQKMVFSTKGLPVIKELFKLAKKTYWSNTQSFRLNLDSKKHTEIWRNYPNAKP